MSLAPDLSAPGLTTFESLSDDCLLCVVDELKKMVCVYTLVMRRPNPDLQAFSGVNKRLRQLCIPVMFNLEHLTIKLWQRKSILIPQLKALQQSFAAERVKALAIDRFFETDNDSALLGQQIATTLPSLSNLRELYLAHTTMFDSAAKAALSLVSLDLVEKLSVKDVPDSACFIRACPNLRVFVSDFPCNKPKTTLKVLSESPVDGLELQNYNGWKPKQLEGGYPQRAFTDHADECATDLCQYLGHITRLSLEGRIKVKPTDLVHCLQPLQNLQAFALATEPWVSERRRNSIASMFYDPFEDAMAKLYEKPMDVASSAFTTLPSLETVRMIDADDGEARKWSVDRYPDGSIESVTSIQLRFMPLIGPFFSTLFR